MLLSNNFPVFFYFSRGSLEDHRVNHWVPMDQTSKPHRLMNHLGLPKLNDLEEDDDALNGLVLDSNYNILVVTLQHQIHSLTLSGLIRSSTLLVHEKWLWLLRATTSNMRSTHLDSVTPSAFAADQHRNSYSNNQKSQSTKKASSSYPSTPTQHRRPIIDYYKAAKLSDFEIAKDGHDETQHVMGTQGYAAPEYVMTGKAGASMKPEKNPILAVNHGKVHPRRRSWDLTFIHRMKIMMVLVLAGILLLGMSAHCANLPATLHLERVTSTMGAELSVLQAKDQTRHSYMGIVAFPVLGSPVGKVGLYYTRVKIGNPPKEFQVMIDTGSDITWLNCISCTGCPRTSLLVQLSLFDPSSSSSAASVSCSDSMCQLSDAHSGCSDSMCTYSLSFEDGSGTSGNYVSDVFSFDTVMAGYRLGISSANITFGCSTYQSGDFTLPDSVVDGVLGFGHQRMSVISQLASHGHTPAVFSHCLKGGGGGVLVLGEIREPGIIYSPLDLSGPYYNLYMLSISINGQTVPIASDVFTRSGGTIVDSGTNLAYLAAEAYDPFVIALVAAVPPSVSSFPKEGSQCFLVSSSVGFSMRDVFPSVSLNFAGGASMVLKPEDYLWQRVEDVSGLWCIGFQKSQGRTILGDLVLKDKIIVYDLAEQRLGWADYDCSSSVNVSLDYPAKHVSRSVRDTPLFPIASVGLIVYISMYAGFFLLV